MSKPLKQAVTEKLDNYALSDARLQQLESLAEQAPVVRKQKILSYRFAIAGAVAAFVIAFMLTPLLVEQGDVRERIAMEVAKNHIKLKPMEVETASIEGIRDYFEKLDFLPVSSLLVERAGLELVGGRYCSLQGITAAQLRVREPGSDNLQTLYQTEYIEDVFSDMPVVEEGGEPVELYVKGVRVKIWVEKGLLFALTELPENATQ
ncbi:MAG: hypothetical protein JSW45_05920 [Thiotrichales bacterium]|nr:MAG: hypothetical protein JSW45_05920 [Thiotrichales bacterium]